MPEGIETAQAAGIVDDDELELLIGARILDGEGLRGGSKASNHWPPEILPTRSNIDERASSVMPKSPLSELRL